MNKERIITLVIGILIGGLLMFIISPKRIAKLSDGSDEVVSVGNIKISANQYYDILKKEDRLNNLLRYISISLAKEKYPNQDSEAQAYGEQKYNEFVQQGQLYNYTEEQLLQEYGYTNKEEMIEYIKDDYYSNKLYEDKVNSRFSEEELRENYNNNYFEPRHVYIFSTSNKSDLEKVRKAIKSGTNIDKVVSKYSSVAYNEADFTFTLTQYGMDLLNTIKKMNKGEVSSINNNDVFGYYIVYVTSVGNKQEFEEVKEDIINSLFEKLQQEDPYITYKIPIDVYTENNINFKDSELKKKYEEYVKEYYK